MCFGSAPLRTVALSGYYSTYDSGDGSRVGHGAAPTITGVPIPAGAVAGNGTDGQITLWNNSTGVEYGFWQFSGPDANGVYHATNGYRYHTTTGYYGRFGFEPSARYGIELPIPDWAPPEASQALWLGDVDPTMKGRVVYSSAFDEVSG